MSNSSKRFLFYSPNVHTGGGLVLLKSFLNELSPFDRCILWLDIRSQHLIELKNPHWKVFWVNNTIFSRLFSELHLRFFSTHQDVVFCFHGLPPVFGSNSKVNLFLQNRNYFGVVPLNNFRLKTRIRLFFEQLISKYLRYSVSTYWVQTPSMKSTLLKWANNEKLDVRICPFVDLTSFQKLSTSKRWDFIYISDGEAHKNHKTLIEAWILLSEYGLRPSLALTLSSRDIFLKNWIECQKFKYNLNVHDLGQLSRPEINELYSSARSLIFPSKTESFGLPLIEATLFEIPILASELDFVRDVCKPCQTFDPNSAISIYRSVRRFLDIEEPPLTPVSARQLINDLF